MTIRRSLSGQALAMAGLVLCFGAACDSERQASAPEPGTELYAVDPGAVDEVLFSSPERKMLAFRWTSDTVFRLVVAARGAPDVERCVAGEGFQRWLASLSAMRIGRRLDGQLDAPGTGWADLRLRDTTQIDPIEVRLRIPPAGEEPVVIQFGTQQYSVDVDAAAARSVMSGCASLGAARPAAPR